MNKERITEGSSWSDPRGQVMKTPDDVAGDVTPEGVRVGSNLAIRSA